jgi:hypothetical protein
MSHSLAQKMMGFTGQKFLFPKKPRFNEDTNEEIMS